LCKLLQDSAKNSLIRGVAGPKNIFLQIYKNLCVKMFFLLKAGKFSVK